MKYNVMSSVLLAITLSASAYAADSMNQTPVDVQDEAYYTVGDVSIVELDEEVNPVVVGSASPDPSLRADAITIDEIINTGKQIWQIILDNKPVVNLSFDTANGLPEGARHWTGLTNWQTPFSKTYQVSCKNLYGMNVVNFVFRVVFTYGGKLDGKGLYIANAAVVPAALDVAWGYTFNAKAAVTNVVNAGSAKSPIAALQMDVRWSIDTAMKHSEGTENFFLRGDGFFMQLQ